MRVPSVPYLEPITGIAWWLVGSAALGGGLATVVLAAGLGLAGVLVMALRRNIRFAGGQIEPLPPGGRGRLWRILGVSAALMATSSTVLSFLGGYGKLAVPLCAVIAGVASWQLVSTFGQRTMLVLGAALIALGVLGAMLAWGAADPAPLQAMVGLVAGALIWLHGTYRSGLLRAAGLGPTQRLPH